MKTEILKLLKKDKININFNKNPIPMDLFLSFLTIDTEISRGHLGSTNGWTLRFNKDHGLLIEGGIVNGVNYLDNIKYGSKLDNPYNDNVNPFYLHPIMNQKGIDFFKEYYKEDIDKLITDSVNRIDHYYSKIDEEKQLLKDLQELK